jgi:para-nitrobenzyl esterase
VVDGEVIPDQPFAAASLRLSSDIPLIVGTTMHEWNPGIVDPGVAGWTLEEVARRLRPRFGERAGAILEAYRHGNPGARPFELYALIISARIDAVAQAEAKATLGAAAVYVYWFGWRTPLFDGRPLAFHCADLPFVFDNTDRCAMMTGGGARARALAAKISEAWIAFARSGDPSHADLPRWPKLDPAAGQTMVLDDECRVANDPDRAERQALAG